MYQFVETENRKLHRYSIVDGKIKRETYDVILNKLTFSIRIEGKNDEELKHILGPYYEDYKDKEIPVKKMNRIAPRINNERYVYLTIYEGLFMYKIEVKMLLEKEFKKYIEENVENLICDEEPN